MLYIKSKCRDDGGGRRAARDGGGGRRAGMVGVGGGQAFTSSCLVIINSNSF